MKPHEILGVAPDASPDEITKAYRKLVSKYHPDKPTADIGKFREVQDAYDTMCGRGPKSPEEVEADRHFRAILGSMLLDYSVGSNLISQALEDVEHARSLAANIIQSTTKRMARAQQVAARVQHPLMAEVAEVAIRGFTDDINRESGRIAMLMLVRGKLMQMKDSGATGAAMAMRLDYM